MLTTKTIPFIAIVQVPLCGEVQAFQVESEVGCVQPCLGR